MGLHNPWSILFSDLVRITHQCRKSNNTEVWYLLENVNSRDERRANIVAHFETLRYVLGSEVVSDATRHNSRAHCVRALLTIMANLSLCET